MKKRRNGYIAIASILVIATVVLTISTSVALLSINEIQTALAGEKNEKALDFIEACSEDALIRLNKTNTLPSSIIIPQLGTCTITTNSQVGTVWTFTTTGSSDGYTKTIQIQVTRGSVITVNSWKEI